MLPWLPASSSEQTAAWCVQLSCADAGASTPPRGLAIRNLRSFSRWYMLCCEACWSWTPAGSCCHCCFEATLSCCPETPAERTLTPQVNRRRDSSAQQRTCTPGGTAGHS
jgi:hypothetical protein